MRGMVWIAKEALSGNGTLNPTNALPAKAHGPWSCPFPLWGKAGMGASSAGTRHMRIQGRPLKPNALCPVASCCKAMPCTRHNGSPACISWVRHAPVP